MRLLTAALVAAAALAISTGSALGASGHRFTATYAGHGGGSVSATTASGSATATGRGNLIGAGSMTGSGTGTFAGTCVTFSGTAVLRGTAGSLTVAAQNA